MKMIVAIIQPHRIDAVRDVLTEANVQGMTVSEVRGYGRQRGHKEVYRGAEYVVNLIPKVRLEIIVDKDELEAALTAIVNAANTGSIGDGKVWVTPIEEVIRVRTGERGISAI